MDEGIKECDCFDTELEPHTCPFALQMNGDSTECTCCDSCTEQCALDT